MKTSDVISAESTSAVYRAPRIMQRTAQAMVCVASSAILNSSASASRPSARASVSSFARTSRWRGNAHTVCGGDPIADIPREREHGGIVGDDGECGDRVLLRDLEVLAARLERRSLDEPRHGRPLAPRALAEAREGEGCGARVSD